MHGTTELAKVGQALGAMAQDWQTPRGGETAEEMVRSRRL
jgi:hypothetical protein